MNDFFDNKISERLGGVNFGKSTVIYKFEIIKRAKAAARQEHPDIELIQYVAKKVLVAASAPLSL